VDIHVTTITHTKFGKYENLVLNSNRWTLWATYNFNQKCIYVSFHQEGIHQWCKSWGCKRTPKIL